MIKIMELIIVLLITIMSFYIPYIIIKFIITYNECKKETIHFYETLPERIEKLALQKILKTPYILQYYIENNKYIVWYKEIDCKELKDKSIDRIVVENCIPESEIEIENSYYYKYIEKPIIIRTIEKIFN